MPLPRRTPKTGASASPSLALPKGISSRRPADHPFRRQPRATATVGITQRRRSAKRRALEMLYKTKAKVRDYFRCRFPGCTVQGREYVEAAHIQSAGMGGNPDGSRGWKAECYVTLCANHHRGTVSIHSGHYRFSVGTSGGDGLVRFVPTDLMRARRRNG